MRTRVLLCSGLLTACFDPSPVDTDAGSSSAAASSSTAPSTSVPTPTPQTSSTAAVDTTAAPSPTEGSSSGADSTGSSGTSATTEASTGTTGDESTGTLPPACQPMNPGGNMVCGDGTIVAGELCYQTAPPLQDVGTFASRIRARDLDGDLDPDALVLVSFPVAMVVLLNDGLGNLVLDDTYLLALGVDTGALDVDAADMDGDTWPDAVVAFESPPGLRVLTNDGGGAFGFPMVHGLDLPPRAVAVGDLDGDLDNDAVVIDDLGVTLHFGMGNGAFGMLQSVPDPALQDGQDLELADLDGDGDLDVVATFAQALAVYLNEGGVLMAPITTPVPSSVFGPTELAVGDLSGDGILDVAVVDDQANDVFVLHGAGDGSFAVQPMTLTGSYVAVGDANSDCELDIVSRTTPLMFDELSVYPGDGLGWFGAGQNFGLHSGMADMEGADFNGDTLVDIAFVIGPTGELGVSLTEP